MHALHIHTHTHLLWNQSYFGFVIKVFEGVVCSRPLDSLHFEFPRGRHCFASLFPRQATRARVQFFPIEPWNRNFTEQRWSGVVGLKADAAFVAVSFHWVDRSVGPPQLAHRLTRFFQSTLFFFLPPPHTPLASSGSHSFDPTSLQIPFDRNFLEVTIFFEIYFIYISRFSILDG